MAITVSSAVVPLTDLLQIKAGSTGTCRIRFEGPQGDGVLLIEDGILVHAVYSSMRGLLAAHAALGEPHLHYLVKSGVRITARSCNAPVREAVLEASRLRDEGRLPVPGSSPWRRHVLVAASIAFVAVATAGFAGWQGWLREDRLAYEESMALAVGSVSTPDPAKIVEASALSEPDDSLPHLLVGRPPSAPEDSPSYLPTVVCRLLIDTEGRVAEAAIYRPREGMAAFESTALETVRTYRFSPAARGGEPVAVWINWPVDFL